KQFEPGIDDVVFQSTLTKYTPGYLTRSILYKNRITCINHSILHLFKIAYGPIPYVYDGRTILEGFNTQADSLMIGAYSRASLQEWKNIMYKNQYTYELFLHDTMDVTVRKELMQNDLNKFFSSKGISA